MLPVLMTWQPGAWCRGLCPRLCTLTPPPRAPRTSAAACSGDDRDACRGEPEQQRRDLASKVREYVAAQHVAGNSGLQLIDLEEPFNYHSLPEAKRKELFDDGIHLTAAGYELMGDLIFAGMSRAMGL